MSRLSTEAEQLVQAGRSALRPSEADRERVFQSLLSRVGAPTGTPDQAPVPSRTPVVAKATLAKISSVLVGLGVAGGGAFWLLRPDSERGVDAAIPAMAPPPSTRPAALETPPPLPPAVPVTPEAAAPSPVADDEASETRTARPRARPVRRAPVPPRVEDPLAREVALLSRASGELHARRFAAALEALDEHERRFPSGALAQERSAARARALCGLGRIEEGHAELARLARSAPGSPHSARAMQACSLPRAERK